MFWVFYVTLPANRVVWTRKKWGVGYKGVV